MRRQERGGGHEKSSVYSIRRRKSDAFVLMCGPTLAIQSSPLIP